MSLFHTPPIQASNHPHLRRRDQTVLFKKRESDFDMDSEFDYESYHDYDNYDEYITFVEYFQINNLNFSNEYEYFLAMNQNVSRL